ncbi:hypothetical protein BX661DRAFT_90305 [Kickxella alabastrina]|uniref:uncharacterized protein n=1 Tax=Kickxella alabastrina TaxID=61397 RepID=UPI00221F8734|nr:uncharacterized protein BX661DRAFT_90305 [Kickxella alabastrina]KAI7830889.1 hypothetical protein BX661DRAFT_90305 [Kickxella alabastrina]
MRMHIDNFKLLLSIENNRLIYDSVYPNGIPTADPPPDSTTSPSIPQNHLSTSTNMSVAVPDSTAVSPTIESEATSPVVTTANTLASTLPVSPVVAKAELPKAKESVAKNSARGSRKNSPQPKGRKVGNRASASASVEPEVETVKAKPAAGVQRATKETGQKGKATAKKASAVSDKGSPTPELPIQNKVSEPVVDAMPILEPVLIKEALPAPAKPVSARSKSAAKLKTAAAAAAAATAALVPEPEPVPASTPAPAQTEEPLADPATVAETNALAVKEKKGAKGTRKTPAPKEKKSRAKPKTAAAKGASNPAAASQPDAEAVQSPTASQPLIPTSAGAGADVGVNNLTRLNSNAAAENEANLSQNLEMSGSAPMANGAGADLLLSPSMLHVTGTPLPVSVSATAAAGPPIMQSPPGLQSPAPGGLPMQMAQIAMAQLNARLTSMAQANGGLRMELPEFLTKEYLHANPQYTTMLRNEIARMAVQQRMQQQGIQNAGNLGPMGSPHVRPGISPNMAAAAAQMVQTTQNNTGMAAGAGASPAPVANLGTPVQTPNANPMLTSPNVRPATLNGNAALLQQQQQQQQQQRQQMQQLQHLQQLQATPEEMLLVQQYCRLFGLQILGAQDPRLIVLVAKAKSGELRSLIMTRMQGLNAQQQQQQMAAGAGQIRPNGLVNIGMPHQPQPMQANASARTRRCQSTRFRLALRLPPVRLRQWQICSYRPTWRICRSRIRPGLSRS